MLLMLIYDMKIFKYDKSKCFFFVKSELVSLFFQNTNRLSKDRNKFEAARNFDL